jgi:putative nucleotidyltransferase with HDIG domain
MKKGLTLKIYQMAVSAVGIVLLISFSAFYPINDKFCIIFFAILAIIAETQSVYLGSRQSVSISSAVIIAATLTGGPAAAVWAAAASVCGSITKVSSKKTYHMFNSPALLTMFNIGNYVISISAMSFIYFKMGGELINHQMTFPQVMLTINKNAVELLIAILLSILVNAILFSIYLFIRKDIKSPKELLSTLLYPVVSLFVICLLGIILTALYVAYGWFLVVLFFAPFMLARYVFITYNELRSSYMQTVESLAFAIEAKDEYTSGHSRRVAEYSSMIAVEMKLTNRRRENLKYAALLHDVGKIGIPESILNKPSKLNEEEWKLIKSHPEKGAHIVEDIEFLSDAVEIIKSHHEWYNGTGYPCGKSVKELSVEAMILCVADAYDAMTSNRPYRSTIEPQAAMQEVHDKVNIQFSGDIVNAFEIALVKKGILIGNT